MVIDWDPEKAASNLDKHGVSFVEAATVFGDTLAALRGDLDHSAEETREHIIGLSVQRRLLHVTFTERAGLLRIISARVVTRRERAGYEQR